MTPSFISTLQNFVLAQAQECFWQKAVLEGNYKNGIVGRLAMRVAEYYGEALREASEGAGLAAGFFPQVSGITTIRCCRKLPPDRAFPFPTVMASSYVGEKATLRSSS